MGVSTVLIASLFFTTPSPVDMPKAEGWIVREKDRIRVEDRFDVDDLWYARTVTGCWLENEGERAFLLADLAYLPPALGGKKTRAEYETTLTVPDRRDPYQLRQQLNGVSPVPVTEEYTRPRQLPRGMKEVRYYEGTNLLDIVCAFRPEGADHWSAAVGELADGDDREEKRRIFEDEFWKELKANEELRTRNGELRTGKSSKRRGKGGPSERELLKRDAAHSVAAYDFWHCTPGEDFVILDDLEDGRAFVASLTNDLTVWRGRFAAALPPLADTTNTLSVARIYRSRADFLVAAGEEMQWSAAYWNVARRELVACLPTDGSLAELRRTFRHEAFHQYLSYATAMLQVSPWLNEGYAQYFEDECRDTFDFTFDEEQWDEAELALPGLFAMDYAQFYAGTDAQRRANYRLAWSVVYFMEQGMREVRHDPFRDLKRKYFAELASSRDMRKASSAAFGSEDALKLFCNEWKKFWKNRH